MARLARGEYLNPEESQMVHVMSRCVRGAYLCGGKFEHRRQWIRERLELLASVFAIDCITFAVMHNHFHLVLRSRADVLRSWSDEEVVRRWLKICPIRAGQPATEEDVETLLSDRDRVAELRSRLSDISWWMRLLSQRIAVMANREDDVTGRFWEGRFKAQLLLDEAAILACAMYVDLNPIRAAQAKSLSQSSYTGARERIADLSASGIPSSAYSEDRSSDDSVRQRVHRWERDGDQARSGWLSPLEIDEGGDPDGVDASTCGRRASLKGCLGMSLLRYLRLLDWTGRQLRSDKRGRIPSDVSPILDELGIASEHWLDLADDFGVMFKRAAGSRISLDQEAERRGQHWMQGGPSQALG